MLFEKIGLIDENYEYRSDMYVGTDGDRITYVGCEPPADADNEAYSEKYDGRWKVLMPGFYNAHGHSPMSILRGYGENLPLNEWLSKRIFPFEAKLYGEAVYWATLLSIAESVRYGIVSTSDMYFFIDDMVRAISEAGLKANVSLAITNFGTPVEENKNFRETSELIKKYNGVENGRIKIDACAHAEYTNDLNMLKAIAELSKEYNVINHVHMSETQAEQRECIERNSMTPAEVFHYAGIFDQPAIAAHCVWITNTDRELLKMKNVTVASCPISNMKLSSGTCNVPRLYEAGVNVAIGTDGVASNNSLNFFEEMKVFALTGKVTTMDASVMSPQQVLRSAARAGAIAQGRDDCGLIKEGFKADLIAVDVHKPNMWPDDDMLNNLIYSADGADVCLTMADGKVLYRNGEYTTLDLDKICYEAKKAKEEILKQL